MDRTVKILLASIAVVVVLAAAMTVKLIWFPSVKETWFQVNPQRLRQVPPGICVVRQTHFPKAQTNYVSYSNNNKGWMVGRNVTFQMLMAMAYQYNPGRIYLPPSAPKNNFDFVVTAEPKPSDHLRAAILRKTGYTASVENRDTDVLALKVTDPNSAGLKISDTGEKQNMNVKNGRLYFTHMKLNNITDGLAGVVKMPVVDETSLTNFYDFSLEWKPGTNPNNFTRDQIDKILAEWGLDLEPDTASVEMLVVKKAN
jgi:uncharacterized protein (TIGR03435 family)